MFTRILLLIALSLPAAAQDSLLSKAGAVPEKYLSQVKQKSQKLESQIDKRTEKALAVMIKQEKRLQRKMMKIDSLAAKNIFTRSIDSLGKLKSSLKGKTAKYEKALNGQYFGYLDTLSGSLGFLKDSDKLLG